MPKLVAPTRRPIVLKRVNANAGVQMDYQLRLLNLVDEMATSVAYWIKAQYRATPPEALAMDASPAADLEAAMRKLARRWQRKFAEAAPRLARHFATKVSERTDGTLQAILRDAGFSVKFKMTAEANDVIQATTAANVALINSIASEHLQEVQGLVMRSIQTGRDVGTLTNQLEDRFGITRRRAATIARSQNNIATASILKVRQQSLGLTTAIWDHSGGGREPRPEHVAFSGKRYDIRKGAFLEGKWTWPGVEINCRCTSRAVIPGLEDDEY